jgi:CSN8/PSMD8/EIF3K family
MSMLALTDILAVIANEPYELSTLAALEKYVTVQLNEKEYDFEANKALLRSYQINAEHVKLDAVVNVMVLSLMRLPSTDFLALSYIVPGKLPLQPKLKQVQKFADLLERAEFLKFWEEYSAPEQSITAPAVGFADFIRSFIMSNTRDTFRNISKDLLQQFLGLSAAETDSFCRSSPFVEQVLPRN